MNVLTLRSVFLIPAAILFAVIPPVRAEEGMWTFDNPPLQQLAAKYNFHPTQEWLDHLRLSSVRINDGGSGSFVSPDGLLLTNHHVARGQLQKNSTAEHDYVRDGFYATTRDQELKSPDLEVNVLVDMQDVTARVQGATKGISDDAKAMKVRDAEIAAMEWQKDYGDAWDSVAHAEELARPDLTKQIFRRTDSQLFTLAFAIVQYVKEIKKPDGERLPQFHEAGLESLRFQMLSPAPIYPATEKLFMTGALKLAQEKLGPGDPYLNAILKGGDVDRTVNALVDGTKLRDPEFRKSLLDGGEAAVEGSTDPMIVAARRLDPVWRTSYQYRIDNIESVLETAGEKLGKARFAVYGKNAYPDATFTLRLSYGTVDGYPYNGTIAPPFTTFYGLYDRAASFSNQPPFYLTSKEAAARDNLKLATPLDFVSTGDIIGGNSGSPVVNRDGELVGLIFDGNIESLAGDYVYDGGNNRAVAVESIGMIEGLRKIYGLGALADELVGKQ